MSKYLNCSTKQTFAWGWLLLFLVACRQPQKPQVPIELTRIPLEMAPQDIVVNSQTGYVYIHSHHYRISVLKEFEMAATMKTEENIDAYFYDMAVDEERGLVYAIDQGLNEVSVIHDTEIIGTVPTVGRRPQSIAVNPHTGWAYAVGAYKLSPPQDEEQFLEGHITVLKNTELIGTIILPEVSAYHVVADPMTGYMYVAGRPLNGAQQPDGVIIVFDELNEIARLYIPDHMNDLAVDTRTGIVYGLGAFDLYRFQGLKSLPSVETPGGNMTLRNFHVHPNTGDVYIVGWGDEAEAIVVSDNGGVRGRINLGGAHRKLTIDPVTGYVYIADFWTNELVVIDDMEVIARLDTGFYPYGIGVNPATGHVYVSNTNEGTVSVFGVPE